MKVVVVEEKEEIEFLGAETKESHPCLFYKRRTCHVREQLKIEDEHMNVPFTVRITEGFWNDVLAPPRVDKVNRGHWLVENFCGICPHLGAKS